MPTILIVDDEPDTAQMISMAIGLYGYQSVTAYTGLEALQQLDNWLPDAVLLDLMLPDLDGVEVARRIRAHPRAASLPILVVSATADLRAEDRCRAIGVTSFIRKPVNIRDLVKALRSLTGSR